MTHRRVSVKAGRKHLPARLGIRRLLLPHRARLERPSVGIEARDAARVVVDAEEIDRLADQGKVLRWPVWPRLAENLDHLLGIATEDTRVEVLPVHVGVGPRRGGDVGRIVGSRVLRLDVDHEADLMASLRAISLNRGAVGAQQVMRGDRRLEAVAMTRALARRADSRHR